jgi:hypothetical protein
MDELKQELARLEKEKNELLDRISELRAKIAERDARFKAGDVIEGKERKGVRRLKVTNVVYKSDGDYDYVCVTIRKDGSDGASVKLWHWDVSKYIKVIE